MKEGEDGEVDWCDSETDDDDVSVDRVLSFFSGRGPTTDLRVKPDVVLPGEVATIEQSVNLLLPPCSLSFHS